MDNIVQVKQYWNDVVDDFDSIYTGEKSAFARAMDHWFRRDMYQRFEWVMQNSGDVKGKRICDFGCGTGRFVTAFARNGAAHVTGVDIAPNMIKQAKEIVAKDGTGDKCDFVLSDILDWK